MTRHRRTLGDTIVCPEPPLCARNLLVKRLLRLPRSAALSAGILQDDLFDPSRLPAAGSTCSLLSVVSIQMGLLVLASPDIAESAYTWIQEIRRRHDERYFRVVEPHFTLVFPTFNVTPSKFIGHVLEHTRFIHVIDFVITHARVVEDDSRNFWHTFLVPDAGHTAITNLHNLLYSGILRQELRTDIPFVPHMGVGTNDSENAMRQLAADINATPPQIEGSISSLTIASYADSIVTDLEQVDLQPR